MKKVNSQISYDLYDSVNDLQDEDRLLLLSAIKASGSAYAPYSKFKVGAAVMLENGEVVLGSNQENAVYPSGLCAERVALFAAAAQFPGIKINSLAVTATVDDSKELLTVSPCGDCRQVMVEYEHRFHSEIKLIMSAAAGTIAVIQSAGTLLPLLFNAENLRKY